MSKELPKEVTTALYELEMYGFLFKIAKLQDAPTMVGMVEELNKAIKKQIIQNEQRFCRHGKDK